MTFEKVVCKRSTIFLTHWGRVTHICVSDLTSIGSDNGLSPARRQAIIRTNAGILLIRPLGTNFSEVLIEILTFSFKKMRWKVSSAKRRPFCLGLNVLSLDVLGMLQGQPLNLRISLRCYDPFVLSRQIGQKKKIIINTAWKYSDEIEALKNASHKDKVIDLPTRTTFNCV